MNTLNTQALLNDLQTADPDRQIEALWDLITLQTVSALPAILPVLAAPNPLVRETAIHAAMELGRQEQMTITNCSIS